MGVERDGDGGVDWEGDGSDKLTSDSDQIKEAEIDRDVQPPRRLQATDGRQPTTFGSSLSGI